MTRRSLKIVGWPAFANKKSNVYQARLYGEMVVEHAVGEADMSFNGLSYCLTHRVDILHVHWLERAFWGVPSLRTVRRVICAILIFAVLKLKGSRIVWTVHDIVPHAMAENEKLNTGGYRLLWTIYRWVLIRCIDGVIFLSASHIPLVAARMPRLARVPHIVTPHPHYRGAYPNAVSKEEARRRLNLPPDAVVLAFIGKIRPYKNVEGLIGAFKAYQGQNVHLLIAGEADTDAYEQMLQEMAKADPRITLVTTFVPDDQLQYYLNAADAVVLPFRRVTNSGSLLLALSFDRPVAVPDVPAFVEIRELVGPDWVYVFSGQLTAPELQAIVDWGRPARAESPRMDALTWSAVAEQTVAFYRRLLEPR